MRPWILACDWSIGRDCRPLVAWVQLYWTRQILTPTSRILLSDKSSAANAGVWTGQMSPARRRQKYEPGLRRGIIHLCGKKTNVFFSNYSAKWRRSHPSYRVCCANFILRYAVALQRWVNIQNYFYGRTEHIIQHLFFNYAGGPIDIGKIYLTFESVD